MQAAEVTVAKEEDAGAVVAREEAGEEGGAKAEEAEEDEDVDVDVEEEAAKMPMKHRTLILSKPNKTIPKCGGLQETQTDK